MATSSVAMNPRVIEPSNPIKFPNSTVSLLQVCQFPDEVEQVHAQLIVSGSIHHPLNPGRLIQSYISSAHFSNALLVFESIPSPDLFAYNTMIRGLMLSPEYPDHLSLLLYQKLLSAGLKPDNHTFTFALKTCSRMNAYFEGKQVHGQMIKAGTELNGHSRNSLVSMYSNCGDMESANQAIYADADNDEQNVLAMNCLITGYFRQGRFETAKDLFEKMAKKDSATWSAMITGYNSWNMHGQALSLFQEMLADGVQLNESTLVSSLSACANLGALDQGRWIHRYIKRNGIEMRVNLGTALIDMYAKCGCIGCSYEVFKKMVGKKDVVTWGAIITAFSIHGDAMKCIQLFDEMIGSRIMPNKVIFVEILSACSHAGLVEQGFHYFDQMMHRFNISPSIEHYGCMVDLLGRAGRLGEAENLISRMTEKPNSVIWGALLSGCTLHKDMRRGVLAVNELIRLGPLSADRYKQVTNFFAAIGLEDNANQVSRLVNSEKLDSVSGLSFIEVDGVVTEFIVGSTRNIGSADIFMTMDGMQRLKR